jgi:hypothetical protein
MGLVNGLRWEETVLHDHHHGRFLMPRIATSTPGLIPVLSAGRHRSPKQGACFMEFASYLAGERWSDHPACTHPALAGLARGVNDCVSNQARQRLTVLIPSVIGLTGDDDSLALIVGIRAGIAALPVVSETRQFTIAVGLLHSRTLLAMVDRDLALLLEPDIRSALANAPAAERWARDLRQSTPIRAKRADIPSVMRTMTATAVVGMAEACVDDSDDRLIALLETTIASCADFLKRDDRPAEERITQPTLEHA